MGQVEDDPIEEEDFAEEKPPVVQSIAAETTSATAQQSHTSQSSLFSFFEYSKGMTSKDSRFCCAAPGGCFTKGFKVPTLPPPQERKRVRSLQDMMAWAADNHDTIQEVMPEGALRLLGEKLQSSSYSTAFSGVDCPGTVPWLRRTQYISSSVQVN